MKIRPFFLKIKVVIIILLCFIGIDLKADIKVTQLEDSFTILKHDLKMFSPLYGLALRSTHYLANLYRYGNDSHPTIQLIRELFYFHPALYTFAITASREKIASYLKPSTIGIIIKHLYESEKRNLSEEEEIDLLATAMRDDVGTKPIIEGLLSQKTFDEQRNKIQEEAEKSRSEIIKQAQDKLYEEKDFEGFIKSKISLIKKKIPLLAQKSEEEVIRIILENQRSKQNPKVTVGIERIIDNEVEKKALGAIKELTERRYADATFNLFRHLSSLLIKSNKGPYPPFMTYFILLAFLDNKADARTDIKTYFDQLPKDLFVQVFNIDRAPFNKERYLQIVNVIKTVPAEKFKAFFDSLQKEENNKLYEEVILAGLGVSLYEGRFAQPVQYGMSLYVAGQKAFTDCVESAIRTFINLLIKVPDEPVFDIDLIASLLLPDSPLIKYYKKHNGTDKINTINAHNDFNQIVSNLFDVAYARYIKGNALIYKDHVYRDSEHELAHELEGGIGNLLTVLRTLFKLPQLENYIKEHNIVIARNSLKHEGTRLSPVEIEKVLQALFKDLSRESFNMELIKVKGENFDFKIIDGTGEKKKEYDFTFSMRLHGHAEVNGQKEALGWSQIFLTQLCKYITSGQVIDKRRQALIQAYYPSLTDILPLLRLDPPDNILQLMISMVSLDDLLEKIEPEEMGDLLNPQHPLVTAMFEKKILHDIASEDDEERHTVKHHLSLFLSAELKEMIPGFLPKFILMLGSLLTNQNPRIKSDAEEMLFTVIEGGDWKDIKVITGMVGNLLRSKESTDRAEALLIIAHLIDGGYHILSHDQLEILINEKSTSRDKIINRMRLLASVINANDQTFELTAIKSAIEALKSDDIAIRDATIPLLYALMEHPSGWHRKELNELKEQMLQLLQRYENDLDQTIVLPFLVVLVGYKFEEGYPLAVKTLSNLLVNLKKKSEEDRGEEEPHEEINYYGDPTPLMNLLCENLIKDDYTIGFPEVARILTFLFFNHGVYPTALSNMLLKYKNTNIGQKIYASVVEEYREEKQSKPKRSLIKDSQILLPMIQVGYVPAYKVALELINDLDSIDGMDDVIYLRRYIVPMLQKKYRAAWEALPQIIKKIEKSGVAKDQPVVAFIKYLKDAQMQYEKLKNQPTSKSQEAS